MILLGYDSNHGTTETVSNIIGNFLISNSISITRKNIVSVSQNDYFQSSLLILGTPSWKVHNIEGMPTENILNFLANVKNWKFHPIKYAIFGLGNSYFKKFCGAVDVIEKELNINDNTMLLPSLRIDRFQIPITPRKTIDSWCSQLISRIHDYNLK